jgi:hypothetical protein
VKKKKDYKTIVCDAFFSLDNSDRLKLFKELSGMICHKCGDAIHPKFSHKCATTLMTETTEQYCRAMGIETPHERKERLRYLKPLSLDINSLDVRDKEVKRCRRKERNV